MWPVLCRGCRAEFVPTVAASANPCILTQESSERNRGICPPVAQFSWSENSVGPGPGPPSLLNCQMSFVRRALFPALSSFTLHPDADRLRRLAPSRQHPTPSRHSVRRSCGFFRTSFPVRFGFACEARSFVFNNILASFLLFLTSLNSLFSLPNSLRTRMNTGCDALGVVRNRALLRATFRQGRAAPRAASTIGAVPRSRSP